MPDEMVFHREKAIIKLPLAPRAGRLSGSLAFYFVLERR
jgi:hypothetical protein